MGFLLAAAAIWLLYVLVVTGHAGAARLRRARPAGPRPLPLAASQPRRAGGTFRRLATAAALVAAVGHGLDGDRRRGRPGRSRAEAHQGLIAWTEFDLQQAEALVAEGRLVFVDVTADWCFTCKVNERLVLETPPVAEAFERGDVIAMQADWTNRDDSIADFLATYGRSGIPFYMLYRPGREPHVFGELITKEGVISVIDEAARTRTAAAASR